MYPYIEILGIKMYMTGLGIVVAGLVFILTTYHLCKKYNQDFIKLFNRLPWLMISVYVLWLYTSFVLESGSLIPTSLKILSPYGYRFNFVGVLVGCFLSMIIFLKGFRRNETKKVWIDIFFFGFINAVIALGIFLVLGDNFIGKEYTGALSITALRPESALVKFEGVYPIGIFLSVAALMINVIISVRKLTIKKVWLGIWGFVLFFLVLIGILPYWNYPAHGVLALGKITLDINYFILFFLILYFLLLWRKLRKPY